jgi:hypothetical protein
MRRFLFGVISAVAIAAVVAACDGGGGYGDNGGYGDPCNQVGSCAACTPVQGCGWCTFSNGSGACVSDSNECSNMTTTTYTFTWDLAGCRVSADASVAGADGSSASPDAASVATPDGGGGDAAAADGHLP